MYIVKLLRDNYPDMWVKDLMVVPENNTTKLEQIIPTSDNSSAERYDRNAAKVIEDIVNSQEGPFTALAINEETGEA